MTPAITDAKRKTTASFYADARQLEQYARSRVTQKAAG